MAKPMRIKTDDQVILISGKDAGKSGRVVRADPKRRVVFVEGLNMVKRNQKARPVEGSRGSEVGGIIEKEGPIHVSNVMVVDPKAKKPTRIGVRRDKGGKRERYAKRSGVSL
jgi:large subunit ribosomal protein L24